MKNLLKAYEVKLNGIDSRCYSTGSDDCPCRYDLLINRIDFDSISLVHLLHPNQSFIRISYFKNQNDPINQHNIVFENSAAYRVWLRRRLNMFPCSNWMWEIVTKTFANKFKQVIKFTLKVDREAFGISNEPVSCKSDNWIKIEMNSLTDLDRRQVVYNSGQNMFGTTACRLVVSV